MRAVTIEELFAGKLDDLSGDHQMYVIRDGAYVLYIGRSVDIVRRMYEHLSPRQRLLADEIGDLFWENKPESLLWQVEAWTLEDCIPIVSQRYPRYSRGSLPDVSTAEGELIAYYHPCVNVMTNVAPSPLPEHMKTYTLPPGKTNHLY